MSGHTPGPWCRDWIYGAIRHINKNVDEESFASCDHRHGEAGPDTPNVRRNPEDADLIAAAPDLLAACLAALPHHQGGHSTVGRMLAAAIAKAKGTNQ